MRVIADFHIHSRFSRATSKSITLHNLEKWARVKGLTLLGTGDFTHPKWYEEIKKFLTQHGDTHSDINNDKGVYFTPSGYPFILSTEISLVYTKNGKVRKVHHVILCPDFETLDQLIQYFSSHGRLDYDGRPIFGIDSEQLVEDLMHINNKIEVIPAHIWTPWFGLLGSKSGFDSVEECFGDQTRNIHALETGLSSDPEMNWRLSRLDNFFLVSFSDSHSYWPWRLGREATIFDFKISSLEELSYDMIIKAIRTGYGLKATIEVDPSFGKYHYTGHRKCGVVMSPEIALAHHNICPVCNKPLTVGVLERVEQLADRAVGIKPKNARPYYKLIPLSDLIAALFNTNVTSQKVWKYYNTLIKGSNEYSILLDKTKQEIIKILDHANTPSNIATKLAEIIINNRMAKIKIRPGYDGVYGKIVLDQETNNSKQETKKSSNSKGYEKMSHHNTDMSINANNNTNNSNKDKKPTKNYSNSLLNYF